MTGADPGRVQQCGHIIFLLLLSSADPDVCVGVCVCVQWDLAPWAAIPWSPWQQWGKRGFGIPLTSKWIRDSRGQVLPSTPTPSLAPQCPLPALELQPCLLPSPHSLKGGVSNHTLGNSRLTYAEGYSATKLFSFLASSAKESSSTPSCS